jgi:hypothetical protein
MRSVDEAAPKYYHTYLYWKLFNKVLCNFIFLFGATASPPQWARTSSFTRFLDYTQWGTTVGRTPLDEGSARRRDLYLATQNTHNRQTFMLPAGFKPKTSASERPQTYALYVTSYWKKNPWFLRPLQRKTFLTFTEKQAENVSASYSYRLWSQM